MGKPLNGCFGKVGGAMSSGNSVSQKRRCDGCGIQFQPRLDGVLCPACVDVVIANGLDEDDWEQHKLREEYET